MEPLTIVQMLEKIDFSTGSVVQMFEAAAGLAARGHTVLAVTRPNREMAQRCAEVKVEHVPLPLRHEFDVFSAHRFAHVARERKVDVVHVHKGIAHAVALGATFMGAALRPGGQPRGLLPHGLLLTPEVPVAQGKPDRLCRRERQAGRDRDRSGARAQGGCDLRRGGP